MKLHEWAQTSEDGSQISAEYTICSTLFLLPHRKSQPTSHLSDYRTIKVKTATEWRLSAHRDLFLTLSIFSGRNPAVIKFAQRVVTVDDGAFVFRSLPMLTLCFSAQSVSSHWYRLNEISSTFSAWSFCLQPSTTTSISFTEIMIIFSHQLN